MTGVFGYVIIIEHFAPHKGKALMRVRNKDKYGEIVAAINDLFLESGQAPSVREIGEAVRMPIGSLMRYLGWMREEGLVDYEDGKYRGISTEETRKAKVRAKPIPIVGSIACGTPTLSEVNIESYISLSTEFLGRGDHYFVKASGESMIDIGINPGDLVLVKQQEEAYNGQIVVILTEDGENTLKRYYRDDKLKMIRLRPENSAMEDILVKECRIQGVAIMVIKDLR